MALPQELLRLIVVCPAKGMLMHNPSLQKIILLHGGGKAGLNKFPVGDWLQMFANSDRLIAELQQLINQEFGEGWTVNHRWHSGYMGHGSGTVFEAVRTP